MFRYVCIINKKDKDLIEKLISFGYIPNSEKPFGQYLVCYRSDEPDKSKFSACNKNEVKNILNLTEAIDCGDNVDLFLAISSLRENTDKDQWFVSKGWQNGFGKLDECWVYCTEDTFDSFGQHNDSPNRYQMNYYLLFGFKKATIKELINHFK